MRLQAIVAGNCEVSLRKAGPFVHVHELGDGPGEGEVVGAEGPLRGAVEGADAGALVPEGVEEAAAELELLLHALVRAEGLEPVAHPREPAPRADAHLRRGGEVGSLGRSGAGRTGVAGVAGVADATA